MCNKENVKSVIIFTAGSGVISRTLTPFGLQSGAEYVKDELRFLTERCKETNTIVIVASEMALFDKTPPQSTNSFRDNRNVAFNEAVRQYASELHLPFIDNYDISLSAGKSKWSTV